MPNLKAMFHDHPARAGESYFEHMGFAFGFSARLFRAAFAAFIHGMVPAVCETTASSTVQTLHTEISERRRLVNDQHAVVAGGAGHVRANPH